MTPTLRGAGLMTLAMALFAVEDALIKGLGAAFAPAQIVWMLGLGGAAGFALLFALRGEPLWSPAYRAPRVLLRSGCEAVGSLFFVTALTLAPLAFVSAVIQATPLVVAAGSVLFLGARVGWRRWAAIAVGFAGVLVILRPWSDGAPDAAWLAVAGMLGLAARDLVTRTLPPDVAGPRLSLHAFAALALAGAALQAAEGTPVAAPDAAQLARLAACVGVGMAAYLAIVAAVRSGDLSVVSSFRYSRMLFALAIAVPVFGERPDALTLVGAAVVIASGGYALWREARAPSHA